MPARRHRGAPGLTFLQALRGRHFWFMAVGLFSCSGMMTALITNAVPLLQENGNAASAAALVASVFGIAVVVGRVAVGGLIDRFWGPMVGAALMFPGGARRGGAGVVRIPGSGRAC